MTFSGRVTNGVIVLPANVTLPEGTEVEVTAVQPVDQSTIGKRLLKFSGIVTDLPADFAEQHDHYIHGTPKK
jgi:hypothetical protein